MLPRVPLIFCLLLFLFRAISAHRSLAFPGIDRVFSETPSVQPRSDNRLLNNSLPLHYRLDLSTNIHSENFVFSGTAQIRFRVLEATTHVRLNSHLLTITSCTLFDTAQVQIPGVSCSNQNRFLEVAIPSPLPQNGEFILQVIYTGEHRAQSEGFHSSFYNYNGQTRYLASTQFQSVFAREAFPCFDEPSFRVPIAIRISHDPSYNALSNAEVESSVNGVTVFRETWGMPSYLVAFVVSDFLCTEKRGRQRICAPPNRMDEVALAVEASDLILLWMEKAFDEDYGHEKLDHVAIPTFEFGGMENWGLIVYQ